jgi:hypothetical protein
MHCSKVQLRRVFFCLCVGCNLTKDEWVHYLGPDTPGIRAVTTSHQTGKSQAKIGKHRIHEQAALPEVRFPFARRLGWCQ